MLRRLWCRIRGHVLRRVDVTEGVFWYCGRCLETDWQPSDPPIGPPEPPPLPPLDWALIDDSEPLSDAERFRKGPKVTPMAGRFYDRPADKPYWIGEDE